MIIIVVVGIIVIIIVGAIKSSKVSQNLGSASYFKGAEGVQFYIWLEFKMVIIIITVFSLKSSSSSSPLSLSSSFYDNHRHHQKESHFLAKIHIYKSKIVHIFILLCSSSKVLVHFQFSTFIDFFSFNLFNLHIFLLFGTADKATIRLGSTNFMRNNI